MLNTPSKVKEDRTKSIYKVYIQGGPGDLGKSDLSGMVMSEEQGRWIGIHVGQICGGSRGDLSLCVRSGCENRECLLEYSRTNELPDGGREGKSRERRPHAHEHYMCCMYFGGVKHNCVTLGSSFTHFLLNKTGIIILTVFTSHDCWWRSR